MCSNMSLWCKYSIEPYFVWGLRILFWLYLEDHMRCRGLYLGGQCTRQTHYPLSYLSDSTVEFLKNIMLTQTFELSKTYFILLVFTFPSSRIPGKGLSRIRSNDIPHKLVLGIKLSHLIKFIPNILKTIFSFKPSIIQIIFKMFHNKNKY